MQCAGLVAFSYDNFINQHVVATFAVMDTDFGIFCYFRGINYTSIRSHVGDGLAKLVAYGLACFRSEHDSLARRKVGDGTKAFGSCRGRFGLSACSTDCRGRGTGCLRVRHGSDESGRKRDTKE